MSVFLVKRLLISIPTLLAISIVIFTILALAPGDPMGEFAANPAITAEVRENIRRSLGLDQPLPIRYIKWIWAFMRGDLGYSFTSRTPVIELIQQRLPATLAVVGVAYILSILIAFPLGIYSAVNRHSWLDQIVTFISFIGISMPTFLTGLLLILIFSVQLKWFPSVYSSTLQVRDFQTLIESIKQAILPILVLTLYQGAVLIRYIRAALLEELPQDYLRTAISKGLSTNQAIRNHAVKNALIPVVTLIALEIPSIFTGALVTEQVFRVPGIGALLIESINRSDTPVVMGITFTYGILIVIFNLIADIIYGFLDPRIKYD